MQWEASLPRLPLPSTCWRGQEGSPALHQHPLCKLHAPDSIRAALPGGLRGVSRSHLLGKP